MSETPFTTAQLDAVDVAKRHLNACVVAGPGSGKTTVLVEYFCRLVAERVDPMRILAITFTEKAAANMRRKLAEAFDGDSAIRAKLERAWVSTVHGFCARLLRENAVFAGVDPDFYVADERESWRLQQEAIAEAMETVFQQHPEGVRALIRGLSSPDFEEAILGAYDAMRGAGVRIEELSEFPIPAGVGLAEIADTMRALRAERATMWSPAQKMQLAAALEGAERIISASTPRDALRAIGEFSCNLNRCKKGNTAYDLLKRMKDQIDGALYVLITGHYASERQLLLEILRRFDQIYRDRKRQAGALDFADLEEFSVRLLEESPETRARLQAQFDHVLMDEFQDTNGQQAKLLKLVRPPDRFYAVGDINQSIFGFRHAEPEGFDEYRNEVERTGRHLVNLVDNFRSRAEILQAVETVLEGREGIVPRRLVPGRKFEDHRSLCVEALYVRSGESDEARWVARRILELTDEGFEFAEFAVLVRNTEVLGDFAAAFGEAGIPFVVNRGRGFYEAREVNDLTHLLRVIANPRDEISLAAVLRSPLCGVSDEALLRLKVLGAGGLNLAATASGAVGSEQFDPADLERLTRFRENLASWRIRREYVSFDRLLLAAIDETGYWAESGARGEANIDKFLGQAREAASRMSLDAFIEELALVRASNPREPDAPPEDSVNAVQVMTVHSAKGLEFPVVFVAAMHKGVETNPPVIAFSRRYGIGARWRMPGGREEKDDLFQHYIREERKRREEEESHRLLYVAMTRAEQHLVLSFSGRRQSNWAEIVADSLNLELNDPRDEELERNTSDGRSWRLRLLVANHAPELRKHETPTETRDSVEFLPRPAISEQQDTNATVTGIATFAACPRKYFLSGYLGFEGRLRRLEETTEEAELSAGEFGTQVHALLAGNDIAGADPQALRLAGVFRQSVLGRRAAKASRIEREFDFLMSVEDMVIRGQVDLWFEERDELVIVDYKTDSVTAADAHQRAQDYALQLRLYAMAVERVAGRAPDRAFLHFLRPDTVVEVDLAPSLLESPEQVVREFQEAQSTLQFPLIEAPHCHRCEFYRDLCPAGSSETRG
jgi:ATP-dependent helicase/nuclease subunit A